jgi:hypothetical protein
MPATPPTTPSIIVPFLSGWFTPPGGMAVMEAEEEEAVRLVEAMLENWVEEDFVVWDTVINDRDGLISVTCPFTSHTPFPESNIP